MPNEEQLRHVNYSFLLKELERSYTTHCMTSATIKDLGSENNGVDQSYDKILRVLEENGQMTKRLSVFSELS